MLRRLLYSWYVRFAVILPLVHAIVSGVLLWSTPLTPVSDGSVSIDRIAPVRYLKLGFSTHSQSIG